MSFVDLRGTKSTVQYSTLPQLEEIRDIIKDYPWGNQRVTRLGLKTFQKKKKRKTIFSSGARPPPPSLFFLFP